MTSIAASRPPVVRILPFGTALIALAYIVPALWIVIAPHGFFNTIGPFGTYNGHYLGDAAALQAGIGVALAAAVAVASLRPGALLAALLATGFHTSTTGSTSITRMPGRAPAPATRFSSRS